VHASDHINPFGIYFLDKKEDISKYGSLVCVNCTTFYGVVARIEKSYVQIWVSNSTSAYYHV
jgi:hypothetical protein